MLQNADLYASTANTLADVAGTVIRPWFRTPLSSDDKADASPVTIADRTAERVMRAVLLERHPDHGILGEEFGLENPGAGYRWTLDPIDGTRAFITGRPTFGTLIALSFDGKPLLGLIDQPVTGERWVGITGRPTLFRSSATAPFREIHTRLCPDLAQADLSCTAPEIIEDAPRPVWNNLKSAVRRVSWGGDCYAYGLLAMGCIDVIAECTMKSWDWSALVPVVEGAGGRMTDWNGDPLRPEGDGTVLAVGNPALLHNTLHCLQA